MAPECRGHVILVADFTGDTAMFLRLTCCFALLMVTCFAAACTATQESSKQPEPRRNWTETEKADLAKGVHSLLKEQCYVCHGEAGKKVYGKIDFILDHDKLVKSDLVKLDKPEESELYTECEKGSMPRKFDENGKPKIKAPLSAQQNEMILNWIKAGAPKWDAK